MIPHWFVSAPWERRLTGHQGVTYLCWTFVDLPKGAVEKPEHAGFRRHERRHVQQSVVITGLWLAVTYALTRVFHGSPLWLLTALIAWPLAYWVVSVVWKLRTGRGYTDNWFERDARRYAGGAG